MEKHKDTSDGKHPYQPPRLMTISLRPEEAVLSKCKNLNAGIPFGGNCDLLGIQSPCIATQGS
jgi:hypothetical protein